MEREEIKEKFKSMLPTLVADSTLEQSVGAQMMNYILGAMQKAYDLGKSLPAPSVSETDMLDDIMAIVDSNVDTEIIRTEVRKILLSHPPVSEKMDKESIRKKLELYQVYDKDGKLHELLDSQLGQELFEDICSLPSVAKTSDVVEFVNYMRLKGYAPSTLKDHVFHKLHPMTAITTESIYEDFKSQSPNKK